MEAALAIFDVIAEQGFGLEAEGTENRDGIDLFDHELADDLFDAHFEGDAKRCFGEQARGAETSQRFPYEDAEFGDVVHPGHTATVYVRVGADVAMFVNQEERLKLLRREAADPCVNFADARDIAAQVELIVVAETAAKRYDERPVVLVHEPERERTTTDGSSGGIACIRRCVN
ncbi:MAG: hypothetical protein R3B97_17540 [Dehalococcoidia bacterium]